MKRVIGGCLLCLALSSCSSSESDSDAGTSGSGASGAGATSGRTGAGGTSAGIGGATGGGPGGSGGRAEGGSGTGGATGGSPDGQGGTSPTAGNAGQNGGGNSDGPDVPPETLLDDLDEAQKIVICDWNAELVGGYGHVDQCGMGKRTFYTDQAQCVDYGFKWDCPWVTVKHLADCAVAQKASGGCNLPEEVCSWQLCRR